MNARLAGIAALLAGIAAVAWFMLADRAVDDAPSAEPPPREIAPLPSPDVPATPTLAEIALVAEDAARNTALYALVADADVDRLQELLAQLAELPATPHRYDLARVIYVRFAALAPRAAAEHALGANYKPSWIAAIIRAWAHADLNAAMDYAEGLEPEVKAMAAGVFLQLDLSPAQRDSIADRLDAKPLLAQLTMREELARVTPEQAWHEALLVTDEEQRWQQLSLAARAWTREDPQAAMRAALEVAGDRGMLLQGHVIHDWMRADRGGALEWLARQQPSARIRSVAAAALRALAERDVESAVATLDILPSWMRQEARRSLLWAWLDADVTAAVAWYDSWSPADKKDQSFSVGRAYASRHPDEAFRWALAADARVRSDLLRSIVLNIEDAEVAERLFRSIDDPALQADIAFTLYLSHWSDQLNSRDDRRNALQRALSFAAEEVRNRLASMVFEDWAKAQPDEAINELRRLRDDALRKEVFDDVLSGLLANFDVTRAERLFETAGSDELRQAAARALYMHFAHDAPDPDKASFYMQFMRSGRGG